MEIQNQSEKVAKNGQIKGQKMFRPWVTCHCVDCNINIDSKALLYATKMALKNKTKQISKLNNELILSKRRDSVGESSEKSSAIHSEDHASIINDRTLK